MSQSAHPTAALHDLADGRLDGGARQQVEHHLRDCLSCQRELEAVMAVKRAVARLPDVDLPPGLDARLTAALDAERQAMLTAERTSPAAAKPSPGATARGTAWRWAAPLGLAAALVLIATIWWRPAPNLPRSAASAVADYQARRLSVETNQGDAAALNAYFSARVSFPVRVFDLAMMGYTLEGGRVHDIGGRQSALWVYRGTAGSLICQMYQGLTAELPPPSERREANGFTFLVYHEDGGTQVFWQEGDIVCVLASSLPAEDVIQLAIAKAMKP